MREKKQNWYVNRSKYHFIYKTTCSVNGKYYYGMHSTNDLEDGYIGSGTRLWHSIKKYGRENFKLEVIEFCIDRESLKKREAELITEEMLKDQLCMNLTLGGEGGWETINQNLTHDERRRICSLGGKSSYLKNSAAIKTRGANSLKRLHESGAIKYDTFKGKTHTSEARKKIGASSKQRTGENNHQFGKQWAWVNNGIERKKIPREELCVYLANGWVRGMRNYHMGLQTHLAVDMM